MGSPRKSNWIAEGKTLRKGCGVAQRSYRQLVRGIWMRDLDGGMDALLLRASIP